MPRAYGGFAPISARNAAALESMAKDFTGMIALPLDVTDHASVDSAYRQLRARHGDIWFYLSHGCCDGTAPMCLAPGEMTLTATDVQLGTVAGAAFWLGQEQRDYLSGLHLTLDVAPGNNGGFSLEDGTGQRFVLRMRPWTNEESEALLATAQAGPERAPQPPDTGR